MTILAVGAIFTIVLVFMTGYTLTRQTTEAPILMAFRATQACMFSGQREPGNGMVKACIAPAVGCVTHSAVCAELSIMIIIRGVTCITVRGCSLIAVDVT